MDKSSADIQARHDEAVEDFHDIIEKLHKRIEDLNKQLKERTATSSPRSNEDTSENDQLPLSKQLNQGYLETDLTISQIHSEIIEPVDYQAEIDNLRIEMKTMTLKLRLAEGKMIILKREKEDLEEILEKEKEMLIECQNINQMLVKKYTEAEKKLQSELARQVVQKEQDYGQLKAEDVNEMKDGEGETLFSRVAVGRNGGGKSFEPVRGISPAAKSITDPMQVKQLYEQAVQLSQQNSRLRATLSNFENFYHLTSEAT